MSNPIRLHGPLTVTVFSSHRTQGPRIQQESEAVGALACGVELKDVALSLEEVVPEGVNHRGDERLSSLS
jgi:hypothetical protein